MFSYVRFKISLAILAGVLAMSLTITGHGQAQENHSEQEVPLSYLHGLNSPHYEYITSENLGRGFHTYIRLPANYETSKADYPVVYLLDGGATFPILAGYYNYLALAEDVPNIIIIGISYGANTFEGGNMRSTDYTAASDERSYWGGAPGFQSFLKQNLLPKMESKYRINKNRRIIMGQSIAGQFVLFTALNDPTLFWGHIASNPALHRNLPFFLNHPIKPSSSGKLFISLAENDDEQFKVPASEWVDTWQNKSAKPWDFRVKTQEGHNHFSSITSAFRDGLMWFFANTKK